MDISKLPLQIWLLSLLLASPETGKNWGYFKMEVLGRVDRDHVNCFIKKNTEGDIAFFTNKNTTSIYPYVESGGYL